MLQHPGPDLFCHQITSLICSSQCNHIPRVSSRIPELVAFFHFRTLSILGHSNTPARSALRCAFSDFLYYYCRVTATNHHFSLRFSLRQNKNASAPRVRKQTTQRRETPVYLRPPRPQQASTPSRPMHPQRGTAAEPALVANHN
jgi:hypothetical protein